MELFVWGGLGEICNSSALPGSHPYPTSKEDTPDIRTIPSVFSCILNRAFLKPQPQEQSDCWSPSVSFHTSSRASPPPAAFPNSVFAVCIFYSTSILWLLIAENHTTFVQEKPQHLSSFDPLC